MHGFFKLMLGMVTVGLMLQLVACRSSDDQDYLLRHPEKIGQMVKYCEANKHLDTNDLTICKQSQELAQELQPLKIEAMLSAQSFGMKVLATQSRLVELDLQRQQTQRQLQGVKDKKQRLVIEQQYRQQYAEYNKVKRQLAQQWAAIKLINLGER